MSIETKMFANGYFSSNAFVEGLSDVASGSGNPTMKMYANGNTSILSMKEQSLYQLNSVTCNLNYALNGATLYTIVPITVANTGDLLVIALLTLDTAVPNANVNGVTTTLMGNTSGSIFSGYGMYYFCAPNIASGAATVVVQSNVDMEGVVVFDYSGPNTNPFLGSVYTKFNGGQSAGANNIYSGNVAISTSNNVLVWGFFWDAQAGNQLDVSVPAGSALTPINFFLAGGGAGGYLCFSDEVLISPGTANANAKFTGSQSENYGVAAAAFALLNPLPSRLYANGQMSVNSFYEA